MTAVLKLVASGFIKLDFAKEVEAAAWRHVEEIVLEETSQMSLGSSILISVSAGACTFLSYGCFWSIVNTTRFLFSLNPGWETSLFRRNQV